MRYRIRLRKALALMLAVAVMACQPAMTILAAETEPGADSSAAAPALEQTEGSAQGAAPEPDTPALGESEPDEAPQPEIPPDGEESSQPKVPEEDGESSEEEKPPESQPEAPTGEEESSQPETPEESQPELPPEESEPELPQESLPEESEPELPEAPLPEIPVLPEIPLIPETELWTVPVEDLVPLIETAPLDGSLMARSFGLSALSAGDGSVAKLVADNHVVMLRADGRLLVWGDNTYGQLGLGSGAAQKVYTPTQVPFFKGKEVADIAVVQDATFVLLSNGELYSFGKGTNGRLGLGSSTNVSTPTLIPGSQGLRISGLYPMKESMVVTTDNNAIYVGGRNDKGQLGDGTKVDKNTPTRIMDNANVKSLHVGDDYAILIKQDDTLWAWGNNASGVFPYDSEYRVTSVSSVSYGRSVLKSGDGSVNITGTSTFGMALPSVNSTISYNNTISEALQPIRINDDGWKPTASRTLRNSGVISVTYVYGNGANYRDWDLDPTPTSYTSTPTNSSFNLGYGASATASNSSVKITASASFSESPRNINFTTSSVIGSITHIMPGSKHWYMIQDGQLYGQGDNSLKQQAADQTSGGYLSTAQTIRAYINTLDAAGDSFSELVVSGDTNYIITGNGNVHSWGGNPSGKTGTGLTASYVDAPTEVYTLNGKSIASIVAGRNNTLFVSHTGDVYAVGDNSYGQSGLGEDVTDQTITMPQQIETFRFSETELPPDAPEEVEAPDEVDAGTQISIRWRSASNAVAYELQRTVSLRSEENETEVQTFNSLLSLTGGAFSTTSTDTDGLGLEVEEVVYNGEQTEYTDTAQSNWDTVTYSVKALNSIGDYSQPKASNAIAVRASSGPDPTTDTTPPVLTVTTDAASKTITITAVDADSGMEGIYINGSKAGTDSASYVISSGETVSIYGKDNAGNASATRSISYTDVAGSGNNNNGDDNNSGSGLTDSQLLAILAALKSGNSNGGLDSDDILTLATALRRGGNTTVNSGVDEALLKALIESLQSKQPTTPKETVRYVQTNGGTDTEADGLSPEILSLLLSQLQGDSQNGSGGNDLLTAFLLVKLLSDDQETQPQEQIVPAPQGTSMTVGIFLTVLTVATILMAAAFPLTFVYFNRKLKVAAGGPKPDPDGPPDGDSVWKDRYNQVARDYNELVDMVNQTEQTEEAAQSQE